MLRKGMLGAALVSGELLFLALSVLNHVESSLVLVPLVTRLMMLTPFRMLLDVSMSEC